ncbi:MAG: hypothetical protein AAFP68_09455 [Pseudomonadota bacterium]
MFGFTGILGQTSRLMHSADIGELIEDFRANKNLSATFADAGVDMNGLSNLSAEDVVIKMTEADVDVSALDAQAARYGSKEIVVDRAA